METHTADHYGNRLFFRVSVCVCVSVSVCVVCAVCVVCVCVCVCVQVYVSWWGPKLRSQWVQKLINHTE